MNEKKISSTQDVKVGLALGSGGAKGLSHIGVIKKLVENNIQIDFISGTSIGAMVGAYYALYEDVEKLENTARSVNWRTATTLLDPTWRGGIVKGRKVEKLLYDWFDSAQFENTKIPVSVVTTDLSSGKEVVINHGDIVKGVRASIAVPPIFTSVNHDGRVLVDGGLCNPMPDDVVKKMGADVVIGVNLDTKQFVHTPIDPDFPISKYSARALNVMRYHLAKYSSSEAHIVIEPEVEEIGLIGWDKFFNSKKSEEMIEKGEIAAEEAIGEVKELIQTYANLNTN